MGTGGPALSGGAAVRRVLVCTPFIWEGGSGRGKPTVHNLLQGFGRAGYEVHVVCGTNRPDAADEILDGVQVHYFRMRPPGVRFRYDARFSFLTAVRSEKRRWLRHLIFRAWWLQFVCLGCVACVRLARRLRPEVAYGINNPGVPPAFAAGRACGAPVVARIMGTEIAQFAGLTPGSREDLQPRLGVSGTLRLWLVRFDELVAFKLPCDAWVVTDDGQIGLRELTEWLQVPSDKLHLWRNGVDKERFADQMTMADARAKLGLEPGDKVMLWVSQLTDWKHPERLLAAVPAVLAEVPRALALFVGDGPERGALEAQASALGIGSSVRLEGFVDHAAMPVYYRAADVFVALYDRANVSNTLLEAMLMGLPVVALDNGLTRLAVEDGHNGLLVAPDRIDLLAPALVRVTRDDDLRARLGSAARTWADDNLPTWRERIDREISMIQNLRASGQDGHPPGGPAPGNGGPRLPGDAHA